tara:strand:- start:1518 stop:1817 length:300 start_codon:yes stop_codon:yes gene_type:complete
MINKKHNDQSSQLFKKLILFIDSALISAMSQDNPNTVKTLTNGLLSIKDALAAEIVQDNQVHIINEHFNQEEKNFNKKKESQEEKDINQEKKLENDQIK